MSIMKLRKKKEEIDNIAQYSQQRRSPPPKRRTDFSLFFFFRDSLSNLQDSRGECIFSSVSRATLDHKKSKVLKEGRPSSHSPLFRNPSECSNSDEQDHSCDKWTLSSSSQTENEFLGKRRGKRTRKPKVHFDGAPFPSSPIRNVRRLRILRYLGLIAPAGSPFSLTRV